MSRVRRSVPRSSDSTSSSSFSGGLDLQSFAQQLDGRELRRERRAELVRDVREHGIARAAHALELGLVAQYLHLQPVDDARTGDDGLARSGAGLQLFHSLRAAGLARAQDRARGGGARTRATGRPRRPAGLEHIAAELADRIRGLDA